MIFHSPHPSITIPDVSLPKLILSRARQFGKRAALVDGTSGRSFTFDEVAVGIRKVSAGLAGAGFKKGDVLALVSPNSIEYGIVFLAAASLGGVTTTLNPAATRGEIGAQVRDSGASFLFTTPELWARSPVRNASHWNQAIVSGRAEGALSLDSLLASTIHPPVTQINPRRDLVLLPYSSGTTGTSKGVMLTHRNLVANLLQIRSGMFTSKDTILGLPPFFHIYGLIVVLMLGLYLGATDIVLPRFDGSSFAETIERYTISHANLVPPLIVALMRHRELDPQKLRSLRTVQSGAAPLSAAAAREFSEKFGCTVLQSYGLTETSPVTHFVPRGSHGVPVHSIGVPVAETECKILDLETGVAVGPDERGELCIRGPQVMSGYLNAPEKTVEMLDDDGWLHTGDVAYADREGHFFIVDRTKELIKCKGSSIAPAELEAILLSHPDVTDAAVIGVPDSKWGEVPKAFVVGDTVLEPGTLKAWLAARVAPHKRVREIEFVHRIPRSEAGKILRRLLKTGERVDS